MVPAGSTALVICSPHARVIGSGYRALVSALNSLPARASTRSCTGRRPAGARPASRPGRSYRLLFSYPQGPPVIVRILLGCYPEIDNLSLQADSAASIIPLIDKLLKPG